MVNIILTGAYGRMGRAVVEAASKSGGKFAVCAGVDVNIPQGISFYDFPVYTSLDEYDGNADVLIDFSHHTAVDSILAYAVPRKLPVVISTTGHTEEELARIAEASKQTAVFRSGNMSLGINLLSALVKKAAAALEGFDIEIVEAHHNQKLDAPSGTALMLADAANAGLKEQAEYVYSRHDRRAVRPKNEIGIHSIRGGTIVGEHEVMFAGQNEVIKLSHSAGSRDVFASGALSAASFMAGKPAGMYNMNDVIEAAL